jgi:plastocyanin
VAATLVLVTACGDNSNGPSGTPVAPEDGQITVRAFEWGYEPAAIVLRQGEEVTIDFVNDGELIHNLRVEDQPAADIIAVESGGPLEGDEGEIFVGAEAEDRGSITFVPNEAGSYEFYCTVQDHRSLGMEGTLIIE